MARKSCRTLAVERLAAVPSEVLRNSEIIAKAKASGA